MMKRAASCLAVIEARRSSSFLTCELSTERGAEGSNVSCRQWVFSQFQLIVLHDLAESNNKSILLSNENQGHAPCLISRKCYDLNPSYLAQ